MSATLNLRIETSSEALIFVNPNTIASQEVMLSINDGEVIANACMDIHEIDMLIAMLQAGKAQIRQNLADVER